MVKPIYPPSDLYEILTEAREDLESLDGSKIALFGGTGFIGSWIVDSLLRAKERFAINFELHIFTRDISRAQLRLRLESKDSLFFHSIDFSSNPKPLDIEFDYLINAATPSVATTGSNDEVLVRAATLNSTKYIIESAKRYAVPPNVLNLSSGAVYEKRIKEVGELNFRSIPNESSYAVAKREAEFLLKDSLGLGILNFSSPRLFSFAGPGIALDQHFAVGNFLQDGLSGKKIEVQGNPDTLRSYLYPTDLVITLFRLLVRPNSQPIDIGSLNPLSIIDLASLVSELFGGVGIQVNPNSLPASAYYPLDSPGKLIIPTSPKVSLEEALRRWIHFLSKKEN